MFHNGNSLLVILIAIHIPLLSMDIQQYRMILLRPEYTDLQNRFGDNDLWNTLYNYQQGSYNQNEVFQAWSRVADHVIGSQYVEEQRRYFLVNTMLHSQRNPNELLMLYNCFNNHSAMKHVSYSSQSQNSINTPQGKIYNQMESHQYDSVRTLSNDLRSKIFVNGISPLVLVTKTNNEMTPAAKWSLFKVGAIITHLIATCLEKNDKDKKKENTSIGGFLALSDVMQKAEEDIRKSLEKSYPILKTHEVKSLVDDNVWWLYDRKNWIICGSMAGMALLLFCLMRDKIPGMPLQRVYSLIIVT